jgi:hypothetical protein
MSDEELIKRVNREVGGIRSEVMRGDNLTITLCGTFCDGEDDGNEHGWSNAGIQACDEIIDAIRQHFTPLSDRITALTADVERLRVALKPFADEAKAWDAEDTRSIQIGAEGDSEEFMDIAIFTAADLRRAAQALEPKP